MSWRPNIGMTGAMSSAIFDTDCTARRRRRGRRRLPACAGACGAGPGAAGKKSGAGGDAPPPIGSGSFPQTGRRLPDSVGSPAEYDSL